MPCNSCRRWKNRSVNTCRAETNILRESRANRAEDAMSAGASAAAAAAAEQQRREAEEEEEMTAYRPDELAQDWEFKIIRSQMGSFGNAEWLRRTLEEEARAGWTVVEKFDNTRVALNRPV